MQCVFCVTPHPQTSHPSLAIANVSGFLVFMVGQQTYIWKFKAKDLHGLAVYVHQIINLKNFLLVCDVYNLVNHSSSQR